MVQLIGREVVQARSEGSFIIYFLSITFCHHSTLSWRSQGLLAITFPETLVLIGICLVEAISDFVHELVLLRALRLKNNLQQ